MLRSTAILATLVLTGCAQGSATRTSQDTAIIRASAAPVCGAAGSARVATRQAAIETLKAGYDRYIIVAADSANNVRSVQTAGTYRTTGTINRGWVNATTTYQPGPTIVAGTHDTAYAVQMFREGDPGAARALSAREALGPNWEQDIKRGALTTC